MYRIKRYTCIFLIFLLASPILTSFCLSIYTKWIQHEMFERIELENLQMVSIYPNQIEWKTKDKELIVGNDYFDVSYSVKKNDKIEFFGLFDKQEKSLEILAEKSLSGNRQGKEICRIFLFIQQLHFLHADKEPYNQEIRNLENLYPEQGQTIYASPYLNSFTPPPNVIVFC